MVNVITLDLHVVSLYGFSHEGSKPTRIIEEYQELIRSGVKMDPIWVAQITPSVYQLLNAPDIPHLPPDNLAGHKRAIAYYRENIPAQARVITYFPELAFHADTLIQDIRLH